MGASFVAHVLFLLCFFATTFSFFLKAESNVSCNEKDKQALLNFKQGLSDPFGVLSSWSDQEDCSTWDEVVYDNKTGQVTKLHLNYWGFGGEISGSLLQLEHLNYLDLSGNDFNRTPIPTFLGSMASLTHLDLRWSNFSGHIPHQLGHLSNLRYLDLAGNYYLYVDNFHWMSNLSSIQYLDLSNSRHQSEVGWLQIMSTFPSLSTLFVSDCELVNLNPPLGFINFTSLQYLDLSGNLFSHEIPNWFSNLTTSLLHLDLSGNSLRGEIPPSIFNSQKLESLYLDSNKLIGKIPESLGQPKHLTYLHMYGALPHCWKYWQSLTHLDLGSNDISGRIPYSIGSLVALQSLHLQNNRISGDIPSSLKKCSNLSLIDIGENPLSVAIPPWIGEMTSLTILRLSSNGFKGHIPLQICQLSSLIVLDLANNRLWGHIPNCLKNISAMTIPTPRLEAQSPYFILYRGTYVENLKFVPKGVELEYEENLGFVKIIDLSSNNLSGPIPSEISVLSKLCFLNLSRNQLIGKIPEKIGIMKKLESIDLSQNHLSGEIPLNLSSLTFLSHLNLSYNNLSGKIPLGTQLQTFDALSYIGNPQLCGNPLPRNCIIREESQNRTSIGKTEEDSNNYNFYIGMGVGFAVGFWAICGVLFFNWNWRHAYFRFLDDMKDWVYVTTVLNVNWLLEKLRSCHL
ncbi:receptor-like protein eix2 [Quercus suber]|uniref:Receptor-like protein eix2 n=1 Tax=Quercus suber TaxID=58331 RepID=A0AAW0M2V3_QUESU